MRARVLLPVFASLLTASPSFAQVMFSIEVAVVGVPPWCNPSLALDANGTPSVVYNDNGVVLARKSDPIWATEMVSSNATVYSTRSLGIVPSGDPVVGLSHNALTHIARRTGGLWSFEFMQGLDPWTLTIALDHTGGVHVVENWSWGSGLYTGFLNYDRDEITNRSIFIPTRPTLSLAVDSRYAPHIVFVPTEGAAMQYWTEVGDTWLSETLPAGLGGAVAVDASDVLHMVYYDLAQGDLIYGTRPPLLGGAWNFTPLDQAGDVGKAPSIAIDALGRPHVSYYDATNQDLRYAALDGGSWQRQTVDSFGNVGTASSIAVNPAGLPLIAYYDGRAYLKLATAQAPTPTRATSLGTVKALYNRR